MPIDDTRLGGIIGGHLHLVPHTDTDEILAHLAGNVREHLVAVGQHRTEHCPRQNLSNGSRKSYGFFLFGHRVNTILIHPKSRKINRGFGAKEVKRATGLGTA